MGLRQSLTDRQSATIRSITERPGFSSFAMDYVALCEDVTRQRGPITVMFTVVIDGQTISNAARIVQNGRIVAEASARQEKTR